VKKLGKAVLSSLVVAVVLFAAVQVLNHTLGPDWYKKLPGGGGVDGECRQPSAQTTSLLATLPDADYAATVNPCAAFLDVLGQLESAVPKASDPVGTSDYGPSGEGDPGQIRTGRTKFHKGLSVVKGRLGTVLAARDAVQCGYGNDRLALAFYRDRAWSWSVGLVAVVRGDIDAVTETAVCTLLRQIPGLGSGESDAAKPPRISFCFQAKSLDPIDGERYTAMWVGSTDLLCDAFAEHYGGAKPDPGDQDAFRPLVWADPLTVRQAATSESAKVGSLPFGTAVDADCQTVGEDVAGWNGHDDVWLHIDTGYISRAWLASRDRNGLPELADCDSV
jgi:hypothetical protein